jgi:hypothetical protein
LSFGAFCPLPIRLRDNENDGWPAQNHARFAADKSAAKRTCGLAWITYTLSGGAVSSVIHSGLYGSIITPTSAVIGTGHVRWTWPGATKDGYGVNDAIAIVHAEASAHGTTAIKAVPNIVDNRTIDVRTFTSSTGAAVDAKVTLSVTARAACPTPPFQKTTKALASIKPDGRPAWSHDADIGDYGGDIDKENTTTEETPYAWTWYRELGEMLGSSFTIARFGEVHAKKLALARNMMGVDRAAERARNNALPRTADEALGAWVKCLGLSVREGERRWRIRRKAASHFAAVVGPTKETIDNAIAGLCGDSLISITRTTGASLSVPPTLTFWPGINPGPAAYDLGNGAWVSERSHLGIVIEKPSLTNRAAFLHMVNVDLFQMLDRLLPAWEAFDWSTSTSGFLLDISDMDFDGLVP